MSASYGLDGAQPGICGLQEVRLTDLRSGLARRVSPTSTCGLSGTQYAAVRFDTSGRLWYVRTCAGDPSGCGSGRVGPFRYSPARGRTERLEPPLGAGVTSLALDGEQPIVQESRGGAGCEGDPAFRCGTVRRLAGTLVAEPTRRDRGAPGGYRLARRSRPLVVARPPRRLACFDADPAPRRRAVLWVGAGIISASGRIIASPAVSFRATAPGRRAVRGTLPGSASGRWRWRSRRAGKTGKAFELLLERFAGSFNLALRIFGALTLGHYNELRT